MWILMRGRTHRIPERIFRFIGWSIFFVCKILWISSPPPAHAGSIPIRVLLLQNLSTFQVSVPPHYTIRTRPADLLPAEAENWRTLYVEASRGRLRLSGAGPEVEELDLLPRTSEAVIFAGGKLYRGGLTVKERGGGLIVVNTLDLEEYLYGVLPKEAPVRWEMAALRAQAIVARTYALYKRARQGTNDYDVAAQYVRDQQYEGYSAEAPRTNQAVDDTRGLVLTCYGELIPAYYHAESARRQSPDIPGFSLPALVGYAFLARPACRPGAERLCCRGHHTIRAHPTQSDRTYRAPEDQPQAGRDRVAGDRFSTGARP